MACRQGLKSPHRSNGGFGNARATHKGACCSRRGAARGRGTALQGLVGGGRVAADRGRGRPFPALLLSGFPRSVRLRSAGGARGQHALAQPDTHRPAWWQPRGREGMSAGPWWRELSRIRRKKRRAICPGRRP